MTSPVRQLGADTSELPVHLTRFIGRDRELDDLTRLLSSARLFTLTGAGGSGKTRLARELAARVSESFARIDWIDLSTVTDGLLLGEQVASAMGLQEHPENSPLTLMINALREHRAMLVLDNCEHVVDAAASFTEALLHACPRLVVLATSREALGVGSEMAWLVPPLASPEAIELFTERARLALPTFCADDATASTITEICRRLDGIPLAIELAAARVRVLTPSQIASRLDDAFRLLTGGSRTSLPRHRTLRATMEWSYALLGAREQVLLRRLSVFAGTFTLEAAESICVGEPLSVEDILDGVAALVDKSLVVMDGGDGMARYRLLETVRQYGLERLVEAGERDSVSRRFALQFLALVESIAPTLVGGQERPGQIERLNAEHDNVRAALNWAVADARDAELSLRYVGSMYWFWYAVGQFREARQFADRSLALDNTNVTSIIIGRAHLSSALTHLAQGEYPSAVRGCDLALESLRAADDRIGYGTALAKKGASHALNGDLDTAVAILDEAIAFTADAPPSDIARIFAVFWRGWAAYGQGDLAMAAELTTQSLTIGRRHNLPTTIGHSLTCLAEVELTRGNVEVACALALEGLEVEATNRDGWGIAIALEVIARVAAKRGRAEDAARLLGAVDAHRKRIAVGLPGLAPRARDVLIAELRAEVNDRFDALFAEGATWTIERTMQAALAEASRHTSEQRLPPPLVSDVDPSEARPKLCVLTLGPLQVFVGGEALDASVWGSARPRELLVYLLMHPEGRTKEQVGLAFWPEASSAQLRNNFHVTLHRLRKALGGPDWVTLVNDRYRIDPALIEQFDVSAFETQARDAMKTLKRGAEGAGASLEQALAHFRGDLLDGEPVGDWHLEHRDRLQRIYIDGLMALGAKLTEEERQLKAADVYRRVLARDELHEDALVALMRCQAAAGERAQALRVYRRFADRLRDELDAEPGAEAILLCEQLQQGASLSM
jgi:predicted ATPase/DNA-binding SARP family transcriptional activator